MTTGVLGERFERWQWRSLIVGVVASAICIIGAVFDPQQFFRAYLFAYLFVLGLAVGSLALVMIHQLTGGAWGFLIRRFAEAQMKTMPLVAVLFLPVIFGLPYIYAWASPSIDGAETQASAWSRYLEPRFFYLRAAAYFAVWLILAAVLATWSRRQDESPNVRTAWKSYKISGPGLLLLGITLHFASIDWLMSVVPGFSSTIIGPLLFSSQLLAGYSLSVMAGCWLIARPEFENIRSSDVLNDFGSLLFTFLVLWAYLAWFQFMLVWIADLPHGNVWYLIRWRGAWKWLMLYLIVVHGVIPFVLLLFRSVKQGRLRLGVVSAIIFVGQWVFVYDQVMPEFSATGLGRHWLDPLMALGLGGIWFACFLWLLNRRPLLPVHDLNYEQAVRLHEVDLHEHAREEALAHG
jgi:hypothetical protein